MPLGSKPKPKCKRLRSRSRSRWPPSKIARVVLNICRIPLARPSSLVPCDADGGWFRVSDLVDTVFKYDLVTENDIVSACLQFRINKQDPFRRIRFEVLDTATHIQVRASPDSDDVHDRDSISFPNPDSSTESMD